MVSRTYKKKRAQKMGKNSMKGKRIQKGRKSFKRRAKLSRKKSLKGGTLVLADKVNPIKKAVQLSNNLMLIKTKVNEYKSSLKTAFGRKFTTEAKKTEDIGGWNWGNIGQKAKRFAGRDTPFKKFNPDEGEGQAKIYIPIYKNVVDKIKADLVNEREIITESLQLLKERMEATKQLIVSIQTALKDHQEFEDEAAVQEKLPESYSQSLSIRVLRGALTGTLIPLKHLVIDAGFLGRRDKKDYEKFTTPNLEDRLTEFKKKLSQQCVILFGGQEHDFYSYFGDRNKRFDEVVPPELNKGLINQIQDIIKLIDNQSITDADDTDT
jgi:hypothetical protein